MEQTSSASPESVSAELRAIPGEDLCFSLGRLLPASSGWRTQGNELRAVLPGSQGRAASLLFRYLEPLRPGVPLASGEIREQLGFELLSRDTCNQLYVMWRLWPRTGLMVSIKENPGKHTHAQCRNGGYRNLVPEWTAPVEAPAVGSTHLLSAWLRGASLHVAIDGRLVLRVPLDEATAELAGVVGLRSDNVRFELLRFEADRPDRGAVAEICPRSRGELGAAR